MDYENHYRTLIERARNRTLECYVERHHVIPKCLGGSNTQANLVNLTAEEHYVAHQLLVKMNPGHGGLIFACVRMCGGHDNRSTNKLYGWLRREFAKISKQVGKQRVGKKNGMFGRRWVYNPADGQTSLLAAGEKVPSGWSSGKKRSSKQVGNPCCVCGRITKTQRQKYCLEHRQEIRSTNSSKAKGRVYQNRRVSDKKAIASLQKHGGDISKSMKECGYKSVGGSPFQRFTKLKSVYL